MASIDDLHAATDQLANAIGTVSSDAPVPPCPGWTVEDLVCHVGWVHLWAAGAIRDGANTNPPEASAADRADLGSWYRRSAAELIETLEAAGSEDPAWSFSKPHRTAGFWLRRQVHEATVHSWDLHAAAGTELAIDPGLAWDGVQEVRDVFYPRQVALGRTEALPGRLVLRPTDVDADPVELGEGDPYELTGTASALLLALWKRRAVASTPELDLLLGRALTP